MGGRTVGFQLRDSHAGRSPATSPKKTLRGQHGFHERDRAPVALLLLQLAQPAPYQQGWSELTPALLPQGQRASLKAALMLTTLGKYVCGKDTSSHQLAAFLVPLILFQSQGNILSLSVGGSLSAQGAADMC